MKLGQELNLAKTISPKFNILLSCHAIQWQTFLKNCLTYISWEGWLYMIDAIRFVHLSLIEMRKWFNGHIWSSHSLWSCQPTVKTFRRQFPSSSSTCLCIWSICNSVNTIVNGHMASPTTTGCHLSRWSKPKLFTIRRIYISSVT